VQIGFDPAVTSQAHRKSSPVSSFHEKLNGLTEIARVQLAQRVSSPVNHVNSGMFQTTESNTCNADKRAGVDSALAHGASGDADLQETTRPSSQNEIDDRPEGEGQPPIAGWG